jgi:hypothetical protein
MTMVALEKMNAQGFKNETEDVTKKSDAKAPEKKHRDRNEDQRRKPSEQWAYAF